ncbi:C4-dicarboxylate ABC transporter [Vibrio sp. HA2012]|uniref:SLC13 family permease n=1 Tax=Vibrio sp. HA2012 TaxID=1971595 RepID=UPI000C2CC634|nr:SLC13 family permease [Vibrio sp. HA2012]PJC86747.1 C4-dicarboxylate ABC transporter [Vibrio sp. HA2012]
MVSFIIIMAIAISIALGYRTKINVGFFAMGFAYIIGCFMLDMSASAVIKTWPIKIFFIIFSVSIFYNFAINNGTLDKLAQHLLYRTRKVPEMLPIAIFISATIIAGLGAGYYSVLAFFGPITLILCEKTKMNKLTGVMAVNFGCLAGSNFMTSASGIIFSGLIEQVGYAQNAFSYTFTIFAVSIVIPVIVLSALTVKGRGQMDLSSFSSELPEPFTREQSLMLKLIILMVGTVLFFPIMHKVLPANEMITFMNSKMNIALIAIIFSIFALLMKLGNQKDIIANVPWPTMIMICGVGMLISIAIKAGTIELLADWISGNIPKLAVPIALCLVGGFMSFFASTLGVVAPALFPIVPSIALSTDLNPAILFTAIIIGAQATCLSPFSSGGSLILSAEKEEHKDVLFNQLLFKGAPATLIFSTVFCMAISTIF